MRSAFLDININVDGNKQLKGGLYQNPTDTGTGKSFRSCLPLQYKRIIIKDVEHRVFRSTSRWEFYHDSRMINRQQWKKNQYPEEGASELESGKLSYFFGAEFIPTKKDSRATIEKRDEKPPMLMLQYREHRRHLCANKVRNINNAQILFKTGI